MTDDSGNSGLRRTIDWKQGFFLAIGIPMAILPILGLTTFYLWGASILLWGLSVIQGFLQNMAFGELATAFPNASGIPGFCQEIFKTKNGKKKKYDRGRLVGGFCGWAYWFVWAPGLAIFILLIGSYMVGLFPGLASIDQLQLNLVLGLAILGGLAFIASRGLKQSASLGLALGIFSIVPITLIVVAPFFTGNFHLEYITGSFVPPDWTWSADNIMLLLGLVVMAQWSACCWEIVAVYGPEYRTPGKDLPKALFATGAFCLVMYVLIQMSVIGTLGVDGVLAEPISPLQPMANMVFGAAGASVAIVLLIGAIILMIQVGYSGAARAMHSMALEGNLPRWFAKTNSKGEPMRAIYFIALVNMVLLCLSNHPVEIFAASAIAYIFVFAIGLFAYVKSHRDPELKKLLRPYRAPRGWVWVALALGIMQIPFLMVGALYFNNLSYGLTPTLIGFGALAIFFPLWIYSQHERSRLLVKETESAGASEKDLT